MKKTLITIIGALFISFSLLGATSFAAQTTIGKDCNSSDDCGKGEVCNTFKFCEEATSVLLPRPDDTFNDYNELEAVQNLPEVTSEALLATVVKTLLGWSMILSLGAIIVAALFYLQSRGKEEDTSKAKGIIIFLVIGIAIMAAAYGIVTGLTQFNFFKV